MSFGSHYGSLPVFCLAVQTVEALVLVVLDVHGLLDNPGHGVLVLGQHSDLELGYILYAITTAQHLPNQSSF